MNDAMVMTIFGSLISLLLGVLAMIGRTMGNEVKDIRKVVTKHGEQLSSMNATLTHLDRRKFDGAD